MKAGVFYIKLNLTDNNSVPKTALYQFQVILLPSNASNSTNSTSNSSDSNQTTSLGNFSSISENYLINGKLFKKNSLALSMVAFIDSVGL